MLNLRIDTEETRMLGVENHVCEVQLVLKSFAYMEVRSVNHSSMQSLRWGNRGILYSPCTWMRCIS